MIKESLRTKVLKFILYNLLVEPLIIIIYLPYQVYFLDYSNVQLSKWLITTVPFGLLAGSVISPVEIFFIHILDRYFRGGLQND